MLSSTLLFSPRSPILRCLNVDSIRFSIFHNETISAVSPFGTKFWLKLAYRSVPNHLITKPTLSTRVTIRIHELDLIVVVVTWRAKRGGKKNCFARWTMERNKNDIIDPRRSIYSRFIVHGARVTDLPQLCLRRSRFTMFNRWWNFPCRLPIGIKTWDCQPRSRRALNYISDFAAYRRHALLSPIF